MPISNATYPLDPTGTLSSNKIVDEEHIITPINYKDYNFFVPKLAPFFATSLVLSFKNSLGVDVPLVENVDYYLTHWFLSASRACSKPIYGSITILNNNLSGVIKITYQTLGGDWNIDDQLIAQIMADQLHNPRTTTWDSVSEMPYAFPVIDHPWDLIDMVGMSELVSKLDDIYDAILQGSGTNLAAHLQDFGNPHKVSAGQTGAYTKVEVDNLLSQKLGTGDTAYNAARFGGYLPLDFMAEVLTGTAANANKFDNKTYSEAKADILTGTAADSDKFNGMDLNGMSDFIDSRVASSGGGAAAQRYRNAFASLETNSWTPIATISLGDVSTDPNLAPNQIIVSGGEGLNDNSHVAYLVTLEYSLDVNDNLVSSHGITSLTGNINATSVGVTTEVNGSETDVTVWFKSAGTREAVTTTALNSNGIELIKETGPFDGIVTTEPAGIEYIANDPVPYVTNQQFSDFIVEITDLFTALVN